MVGIALYSRRLCGVFTVYWGNCDTQSISTIGLATFCPVNSTNAHFLPAVPGCGVPTSVYNQRAVGAKSVAGTVLSVRLYPLWPSLSWRAGFSFGSDSLSNCRNYLAYSINALEAKLMLSPFGSTLTRLGAGLSGAQTNWACRDLLNDSQTTAYCRTSDWQPLILWIHHDVSLAAAFGIAIRAKFQSHGTQALLHQRYDRAESVTKVPPGDGTWDV